MTRPDIAAGNPPVVYIIDDDQDVLRSISFLLATEDIPNRAFGCGLQFLEALPHLEPGCVLVDVRMPRMSGLGVLTAIKESGRDWPVIVMTGHGETDLGTRAIQLGARHFIEKPFDADLLLHCVRTSNAT